MIEAIEAPVRLIAKVDGQKHEVADGRPLDSN